MHDVVVLEIADPAEDGLRGAGLVRVREGMRVAADPTVRLASGFLEGSNVNVTDSMVNLISLFLEESTGGDLRLAAEALRDNSLLSRSKGGSDMLKRLIAMPQSGHFGMNERRGFTDDQIPQLAKWTLRSLADYRAELARRRHANELMEAATWVAAELDMDAEELEDASADVNYWRGQLDCADKALQQAEWEHSRLLHGLDKTLKQRKEFS